MCYVQLSRLYALPEPERLGRVRGLYRIGLAVQKGVLPARKKCTRLSGRILLAGESIPQELVKIAAQTYYPSLPGPNNQKFAAVRLAPKV